MKVIVLDTETTHKYPNAALILEVAAVVLEDGKFGSQFTSLVHRREDELVDAAEAMAVNKITREMLVDAPEPGQVQDLLFAFIEAAKPDWITAFNIEYDKTVLFYNQWRLPNVPWGPCIMLKAYDVMAKARVLNWNPRYQKYNWPSLAAAATYFDVHENPREHRAMGDALTAAQVLLKIMEREAARAP